MCPPRCSRGLMRSLSSSAVSSTSTRALMMRMAHLEDRNAPRARRCRCTDSCHREKADERRGLLSMRTAPSRGAAKERSWSAQSPRRRSTPDPSSGFWNAILAYSAGAPTVSAIAAPRPPRGLSPWMVLSFAVWCSISALSSAPNKITIAEIHIHIIRPIAAPSDP